MSAKKRQQIQPYVSRSRWALKLTDSIAILLGLFVMITWLPEANSKSTIVISIIAIGVFNFIADFAGLSRNWRGISFNREASCAAVVWFITFLLLSALGQFSIYSSELSGDSLLLWFTSATIISLSSRIVFRYLMRYLTEQGVNTRNYAVVGINQLGIELVRNIDSSPDLGLKLLGFYDDRPENRLTKLPEDLKGKLGEFKTSSTRLAKVESRSSSLVCRSVRSTESGASFRSWLIQRLRSISSPTYSPFKCSIHVGPIFRAFQW